MPSIELIARSNKAIESNPPVGTSIHVTEHGSDWYWAAFAVFALIGLLSAAGGFRLRPHNERVFFYNTVMGNIFMAVAYFTLASDLGWAGVPVEFNHVTTIVDGKEVAGIRQVFYARYIGWFLAFPSIIASLSTIAGATWPTTIFTILCQEVLVVGLLLGSVVPSTYKWGYFVFAVVGYFLVAYQVLFTFRKTSQDYSSEPAVLRTNTFVGGGLVFLLLLYPVCWGLSEGGNVIQPDSEAAFYGVLDVLVFVCLNVLLQIIIRRMDMSKLGIVPSNTPLFHEKSARHSYDSPQLESNNNNEQPEEAPVSNEPESSA